MRLRAPSGKSNQDTVKQIRPKFCRGRLRDVILLQLFLLVEFPFVLPETTITFIHVHLIMIMSWHYEAISGLYITYFLFNLSIIFFTSICIGLNIVIIVQYKTHREYLRLCMNVGKVKEIYIYIYYMAFEDQALDMVFPSNPIEVYLKVHDQSHAAMDYQSLLYIDFVVLITIK